MNKRTAAKELRETVSRADAESLGRLAFARGDKRESCPFVSDKERVQRTAWHVGFDAEEEMAVRKMSPEQRAAAKAKLGEILGRLETI